jgi:antitoxin MazE
VATTVKAKLVRIGNSRGIRIPKIVVEQVGLKETVELEVRSGELLVRSARRPREGWEKQFRAMALRGDDTSVWDKAPSLTSWDEREWKW